MIISIDIYSLLKQQFSNLCQWTGLFLKAPQWWTPQSCPRAGPLRHRVTSAIGSQEVRD